MAIYVVGALFVTDRMRASSVCTGMRIDVRQATRHGFVTAREIARDLHGLPERSAGMNLSDINTEVIGRNLAGIDKIEDATVVRLTNGMINVIVTPLVPVARIFDANTSYYINKDGKRIGANARYHTDVPVIEGHFAPADTAFTPLSLMPLLDWLSDHTDTWGRYVTMIKVDSPTDIILIPAIAGHVVNFGAPTDFDSKFARLKTFYSKVLPVKGWEYYDTLSVKWAGQLVATRRVKPVIEAVTAVDEEEEATDVSTMLAAEGVAPGRTRPGQKAHDEKPIPVAASARPVAEKGSKSDVKKVDKTENKPKKNE